VSGGGLAWRLAAAAPRWSARAAWALLAWLVLSAAGLGRGLPEVIFSPLGTGLLAAIGAGLLLGALAPLLEPPGAAPLDRAARTLRAAGLALLVLGLPLSVVARRELSFRVGEGMVTPPGGPLRLPRLTVGKVSVAPVGDASILSKTVTVVLELPDGARRRVGLWPPTLVEGVRLSVVRYGFAPGVAWTDRSGREVAVGNVMLGTLPKGDAEAALVDWLPAPNVMLGVGLYPPPLEDLMAPEGVGAALSLRLEEATLGGTRRRLTDPSAHLWLADGRPERPRWRAQAFQGGRKVWEGHLSSGETVRWEGGQLELSPDLPLWVELQGVRDPWLPLALSGVVAWLAGAALKVALRRRATVASNSSSKSAR
jgi:hypothetical protein